MRRSWNKEKKMKRAGTLISRTLLLGALSPALSAFAQATVPLTAAQLQRACADTKAAIGTVTASYTYKDWEGIQQTEATTFSPKFCVTNQSDWTFYFTKSAGAAPAFDLVFLYVQNGTTYALKQQPDSSICTASFGPWVIAYWRSQGAQLTPGQITAMENNVKQQWCPALVRGISAAITKKMNGL